MIVFGFVPTVLSLCHSSLNMREKIKRFFEIKNFSQKRQKLADRIRDAILACFGTLAPVWKFLFLKKLEPVSEVPVQRTDTSSLGSTTSLYNHLVNFFL